jgi:hypothetical protein
MRLSEPMIIFALRYCLVSASYAPATCTTYLIDHWSEFTPAFQAQILAEVQERLAMGNLRVEFTKTWERVLHHAAQFQEL